MYTSGCIASTMATSLKGPVTSAEQATRIATQFMRESWVLGTALGEFAKPISARRKGGAWFVRVDVGSSSSG